MSEQMNDTDLSAQDAAIIELQREVARLKAGEFTEEEFQNLCHNFDPKNGPKRFCDGCEVYQQKLFGESPITQLRAERDEADRRAGAAERHLVQYKEAAYNREMWLDKAKAQAGYPRNTSFDVVWKEILEKARGCDEADRRVGAVERLCIAEKEVLRARWDAFRARLVALNAGYKANGDSEHEACTAEIIKLMDETED